MFRTVTAINCSYHGHSERNWKSNPRAPAGNWVEKSCFRFTSFHWHTPSIAGVEISGDAHGLAKSGCLSVLFSLFYWRINGRLCGVWCAPLCSFSLTCIQLGQWHIPADGSLSADAWCSIWKSSLLTISSVSRTADRGVFARSSEKQWGDGEASKVLCSKSTGDFASWYSAIVSDESLVSLEASVVCLSDGSTSSWSCWRLCTKKEGVFLFLVQISSIWVFILYSGEIAVSFILRCAIWIRKKPKLQCVIQFSKSTDKPDHTMLWSTRNIWNLSAYKKQHVYIWDIRCIYIIYKSDSTTVGDNSNYVHNGLEHPECLFACTCMTWVLLN